MYFYSRSLTITSLEAIDVLEAEMLIVVIVCQCKRIWGNFSICKNLKCLAITHSNLKECYFNEILFQSSLFKNLTEFSFETCYLIDENIIAFSKYCSNLQFFSITNIPKLTDKSIIEITKNCKYLNLILRI